MATAGDVMTPNPAYCPPEKTVVEAARMMADGDYGIVPVVESADTRRLVGVLTDRDIVTRVVALDIDPATATVESAATGVAYTLTPEASLDECQAVMQRHKVRRVPIVDANHRLLGMVSLADVAGAEDASGLARTVEEVSETDSRQLYSEVSEGSPAAPELSPVQAMGEGADVRAA